ncbi:MAG: hypothetical protein V4443_12280 [Pseudomonadota bacterium]
MKTAKDQKFEQKNNPGKGGDGMALGELATVLWLGGFFLAIISFTVWIIISLWRST